MKSTDQYLIHPGQVIDLHGQKVPLELLFRGMLITGSPGTGKTRCVLLPLLEAILKTTGTNPDKKSTMVISDPKNELGPHLESILSRIGRADDLIVLQPGRSHYNPLSNPLLSQNEITEKIISWARNTHRSTESRSRGESEFWATAQRSLISSLVSVTLVIHRTLNFGLLNEVFRRVERFDGAKEAAGWLKEQHVPEPDLRGICDFISLPRDTTRPCVSHSVSTALHFWSHEPLACLTTPCESTPSVDPIDIIHRGKILLVGCTGAQYGTSITPLLLSVKEHFYSALLARDQIEVLENEDWKPINQSRPVLLVNDEFQSYISNDSSTGEMVAADRLRGFNAGLICATQNLSSLVSVLGDIHHANRLIGLLSNQLFLSNICQLTGSHAEHLLGKKKIKEYQRDCSSQIAPPTLFRQAKPPRKRSTKMTEYTREVPRVDADALARLKTGQYWVRWADGRVYKETAPRPKSFDVIN
jgi:hypothetical protein